MHIFTNNQDNQKLNSNISAYNIVAVVSAYHNIRIKIIIAEVRNTFGYTIHIKRLGRKNKYHLQMTSVTCKPLIVSCLDGWMLSNSLYQAQ